MHVAVSLDWRPPLPGATDCTHYVQDFLAVRAGFWAFFRRRCPRSWASEVRASFTVPPRSQSAGQRAEETASCAGLTPKGRRRALIWINRPRLPMPHECAATGAGAPQPSTELSGSPAWGTEFHTNSRDTPLERRDSIIQADRAIEKPSLLPSRPITAPIPQPPLPRPAARLLAVMFATEDVCCLSRQALVAEGFGKSLTQGAARQGRGGAHVEAGGRGARSGHLPASGAGRSAMIRRREKVLGPGRAVPLDRNAKARILVYARTDHLTHINRPLAAATLGGR